jgi:hypothetical protein
MNRTCTVWGGQGDRAIARSRRRLSDDGGYVLAVLLVSMAIGAVWMSALLPAWRQQAIREMETELIFRGEQYARAIALYNRANPGTLPPSVEILLSQKYLRQAYKDPITGEDFLFLGSGIPGQIGSGTTAVGTGVQPGTLFSNPQPPGGQQGRGGRGGTAPGGTLDPGATVTVAPMQGSAMRGIYGVRSRSSATSIKVYEGFQQYNLWPFDFNRALQRLPSAPGARGQVEGGRGGRGARGGGAQPGFRGRGGRDGEAAPGGGARGGRGQGDETIITVPGRGRGN